MLRQLDYQDRVLATLAAYVDALQDEKARAEAIAKLAKDNPSLGLTAHDFPAAAWDRLKVLGQLPASRTTIPFSGRRDGIGRPVPDIGLKVPTGGGKTL